MEIVPIKLVALFLLSRTIGASFRLFLIASVLQFAVFDSWNIPFYITVIITISLIWLYTYRSGMKTIIWTDALQTTFMLATVLIISYTLLQKMDLTFSVVSLINESDYSKTFFFDDWTDKKYFFKQFLHVYGYCNDWLRSRSNAKILVVEI